MESTTGEDQQRSSGRRILGFYGPQQGKTRAEMTDDAVDALARHMYPSTYEGLDDRDEIDGSSP